MQPKDLGVALVFSDADSMAMSRRQQILVDEFGISPDFGCGEDIPHLTLIQLNEVDWQKVDEYWQNVVAIIERSKLRFVEFTDVIYKETGWYFWLAKRTSELQAVHDEILGASGGHTAPGASDEKTLRYTPEELLAYATHGYRYAGVTFLPHITLGKLDGEDAAVVRRANALFADMAGKVRPVACTLYEKGPFGAHRRAIRSHALWT